LNKGQLYTRHVIDLDEQGEFITKVSGLHTSFISKLEFSTNYGKTYTMGHDYPLEMDPYKDDLILNGSTVSQER
jgi:hypothetical protein